MFFNKSCSSFPFFVGYLATIKKNIFSLPSRFFFKGVFEWNVRLPKGLQHHGIKEVQIEVPAFLDAETDRHKQRRHLHFQYHHHHGTEDNNRNINGKGGLNCASCCGSGSGVSNVQAIAVDNGTSTRNGLNEKFDAVKPTGAAGPTLETTSTTPSTVKPLSVQRFHVAAPSEVDRGNRMEVTQRAH